jgi:hypothetical protein
MAQAAGNTIERLTVLFILQPSSLLHVNRNTTKKLKYSHISTKYPNTVVYSYSFAVAPKDATKTANWDDTLKYKFLLEIIARTSSTVPSQVLVDIAEKWGPPHTKGHSGIYIQLVDLDLDFSNTEQRQAVSHEGAIHQARRQC